MKDTAKTSQSKTRTIRVSDIHIAWKPKKGTCTFEKLPVAMMWVDTTLAGIMSGVQSMVGTERFNLALQSEGRKSVDEDWNVISGFPKFRDGFKAIANIAAIAGWGEWKLVSLDEKRKQCQFRVKSSWEGRYQKALGVCWGSGMLAGKMAGYCSRLFKRNCWATQTAFIARGDKYDEFIVKPSRRSLEKEIENLLSTDRATRADMAFALRKLEKEIAERKQIEMVLRNSQERLNLALHGADLGLWDWNIQTGEVVFNERWAEMLGYSLEEIEPHVRTWKKLIHPDDLSGVMEILNAHLEGKTDSYETEHRLRHKSGDWVWVLDKGRLIEWDTDGNPLRACGTHLNVTERRLLEEDIRRSEEKYRSLYQEFSGILDAIPDALVLLSSDLKIIWSNEVAAKNMHMTPDDFVGQHCYTVRHGRPEPCEKCPVLECYATRTPNMVEAKTPDGRAWELYAYPVFGDSGNVKGVIEVAHNITERKRAEEALNVSEEKYRLVVENANDAIFIAQDGMIKFPNPQTMNITGYTGEELTKVPFSQFLHLDDRNMVMDRYQRRLHGGEEPSTYSFRIINKDGGTLWVEVSTVGIMWEGRPASLNFVRDITQQKKLEDQLLHAQKMEAVGQLAGGVAHDFNNLLTAIIGYGHLLKNEAYHNDRMSSYIGQILSAAERAAILTNDLLTFSRKQIINLQPVNLNKIVRNVESLLLRVIGEDIELSTILTDMDLTIMADNTQIDQILINLATNAQDAMPKGGSLIISTDRVEINGAYSRAYGYGRQGSYALLSVSDTGIGIEEKIKERIFEPFFTTKEVGKGTGLGLAMVYGIIKQHEGYINVYSEPGKGTTFKILLPLSKSKAEELKSDGSIMVKGGKETILIGEDDPQVRNLLKDVLSNAGYQTMEAIDGDNAIEVFHKNKDKIHLLILDVIMPKRNGKEVYEEIQKLKSDMKAIFVSGYSADIIHKKGILDVGLNFISKPIAPDALLKKVRDILDK